MNIPENWIETSIGAITLPVLKVNQQAESDREITYIDISSIDNENYVIKNTKRYQLGEAPSRARQIIHKGDTLFATVRPYLKNIAFVPEQLCGEIASTGFAVLRPANEVYPKYLFFYSISNIFVHKLSGVQYGVSYPAVNDEQIQVQPFPLPPFNEQRRIVQKIEELFSELDKGVESLKMAKEQLKVYRQALLKHAFEGKLTAQWREENKDKLESADQLLEHIKTEREAHYQLQLEEWKQLITKWEVSHERGKKPLKPKRLDEPDPPSTEHLRRMPEVLPKGWFWIQIGQFCFVTKLAGFEYTDYVQYDENGDLPVIKAENAGRFGFKYTNFSYVKSSTVGHLTRSQLFGGEILMVFVGAGVANVAVVPQDQRYFLGPNIAMMKVQTNEVYPRYIEHFLRSPLGRDLALAATKAVAQPSLSMGTIRQIPIALPCFLEQKQIVQLLEEKLSLIDEADTVISVQLQKCEVLRQSTLKRAFSGQLVPQDPNDEPASVLLERLKAEKASQPKPQKSRKSKSKSIKEKEPEYEYV